MKSFLTWLVFITLTVMVTSTAVAAQTEMPLVQMDTSKGNIVIELNPQAAPKTTANFLAYVKAGFYDGTIFHRVIKGFMIQGGGFTPDMQRKPTQAPVVNEADNGLKNVKGTIAMARTMDPNSATSQFFINTVDNAPLDHVNKSSRGWGYCVFGRVVQGMDVVQAIENVNTTVHAGFQDVPADPVLIRKVGLITQKAQPETKIESKKTPKKTNKE